MDALRLAIGTLTVLPVGPPRRVDRTVAGGAMLLAPLVGVLVGGPAAALVAGVIALRPGAPLLAAALGVGALAGLSGALHLDGLADTADGLGSRRDREEKLRIMRQGDIGPFGVVAIVLVLLVDTAALAACVASGIGWQAVLVAGVAGRLAIPWACRIGIPAARPDGLGATVAGTVHPLAAGLATVATIAACALLVLRDRQIAIATVGAVALSLTVAIAFTHLARRALGGITGDTLGAVTEVATVTALATLALASSPG